MPLQLFITAVFGLCYLVQMEVRMFGGIYVANHSTNLISTVAKANQYVPLLLYLPSIHSETFIAPEHVLLLQTWLHYQQFHFQLRYPYILFRKILQLTSVPNNLFKQLIIVFLNTKVLLQLVKSILLHAPAYTAGFISLNTKLSECK